MNSPHRPISTIEGSQDQSQDGDSERTPLLTDVDVFNISDGQTISERRYVPSVGPSNLNHPREFTLAGTSSKHEESRSVPNNRCTSEQEELSLRKRHGSSREIAVNNVSTFAKALEGVCYAFQNTRNIRGSDSSGVQQNRWTSEEEKLSLQQRQRSSRDVTLDQFSVTAGVFEGNYVASQSTRNVCRSDSNVEAEVTARNLQSAQCQLFSPIRQQHQLQYDHECLPSTSLRDPVSGLPDGYGPPLPTVDMRREPFSETAIESVMLWKSQEAHRRNSAPDEARKKAYIPGLEDEVTRLKEENTRLMEARELFEKLVPGELADCKNVSSAPF